MTSPQEGPLDEAGIALAPASNGAYRLWDRERVLFVGMTSGMRTLRSELRRHWRGDFGHTQRASHFECLAAATAGEAHEHYLALYLSSGLRAEPGTGVARTRANGAAPSSGPAAAAGGSFAGRTGGTPGPGGGKPGTT